MLAILSYHASFSFFNFWFILFNSYSHYTNFYWIGLDWNASSRVELENPTGIPTEEAKAEIEAYLVIVEAKINKCLL